MQEVQPELKELARRRSDAYLITLWWVKGTMDTYVEVIDTDLEPPVVYELPVKAPETPNEVFLHCLGKVGLRYEAE